MRSAQCEHTLHLLVIGLWQPSHPPLSGAHSVQMNNHLNTGVTSEMITFTSTKFSWRD